ncbi:MAG TPA: lysylphosphatidylglycerol synthase transmembrane domain-containing protein [Actinomycetes bacterium]|nr:lysylphosphatidylglycerol synthase transmembrane domain-containing protein [Actinomycetes bacterium]
MSEPAETPFGTETEVEVPRRGWLSWRGGLQTLVGAGVAVALIVWALPKVTGSSWPETAEALERVSLAAGLGMFALLLLAMWCYTFVLSASLPGLSHYKALIVNVAGSSVSNLLPFGGAVGVGITYGMCRSWGFSRSAIVLSAVVSGVWNTLAKLVMPALGLAALLLGGEIVTRRLAVAAGVAVAVLLLIVAVATTVLASERAALAVGRGAARVGELALRLVRSHRHLHWDSAVIALRHRTTDLVRAAWVRMTLGMTAFVAVYAVLFWMCLRAVGADPTLPQVFAAYTLGRLLTSVVVTPGGLGISETGAAALLVALGVPAAPATAGVLLFAFYVHVLEVPLGALGWLAWSLTKRTTPSATR